MTTIGNRWTPLKPHPVQHALYNSRARFRVVPAGRRSGKTELAKRWLIERACRLRNVGRKYAFAAPTRQQVKDIYWHDIKRLIPKRWVSATSETELTLTLMNQTRIVCAGMDKPARIEGEPLDGIVLDEYGNMKATAWTEHVSPALDTPGRAPGWAWMIGVPEGRNHYFDIWTDVPRLAAAGESWERFTWFSADIMSAQAISALRARMDERTYRQELEGSFESYAGLAYYSWSEHNVVKDIGKLYDPDQPLIVCFDFNNAPGVAVVCQEWTQRTKVHDSQPADGCTLVIDEVWIDQNSNTPLVVDRLLEDWRYHRGEVLVYGDCTGAAKVSSAVAGSDWDIIRRMLRAVFGDRVSMRNRRTNPAVRSRINAVCSRLHSTDGSRRVFVDPVEARHVVHDFERVELIKGSAGELLKEQGGPLTHSTDALGYYIADRYPVRGAGMFETKVA